MDSTEFNFPRLAQGPELPGNEGRSVVAVEDQRYSGVALSPHLRLDGVEAGGERREWKWLSMESLAAGSFPYRRFYLRLSAARSPSR